MRLLHLLVVMFCCFSAVCPEASAVLEVSGPVGGEASIYCPASWTTNNSSEGYRMYFCKGDYSRENVLIQTEKKMSGITRRGRYGMEVNAGDAGFTVTVKRLRKADAGIYHCGVWEVSKPLHQEVKLMVRDASTVPPGAPPSSSTSDLQTEAEALLQGSGASTAAASTLPTAQHKTEQPASRLKDTTLVIIVSVSLALLVCAIIPLIFCRHCSSNADDQSRNESCCEENVASTKASVRLQPIQPQPSSLAASRQDAVDQAP